MAPPIIWLSESASAALWPLVAVGFAVLLAPATAAPEAAKPVAVAQAETANPTDKASGKTKDKGKGKGKERI